MNQTFTTYFECNHLFLFYLFIFGKRSWTMRRWIRPFPVILYAIIYLFTFAKEREQQDDNFFILLFKRNERGCIFEAMLDSHFIFLINFCHNTNDSDSGWKTLKIRDWNLKTLNYIDVYSVAYYPLNTWSIHIPRVYFFIEIINY